MQTKTTELRVQAGLTLLYNTSIRELACSYEAMLNKSVGTVQVAQACVSVP